MLRPYQSDLVRRFFESTARRSLVILPTGAGKTRVAAAVIDHWPGSVVFVADRMELVEQAHAAMPSAGVLIGQTYKPGSGKVTIVGVHTVARRDLRVPADLVIIDEAHMAAAPTWRKVLSWYPEARILGLTATAYRYGGGSLADLFDEALAGPSVPELISRGWLCPVRTFASPEDIARAARVRAGEFVAEDLDSLMRGTVLKRAVSEWARLAHDRPTIAFATSKAHAQDLADALAWYGPALVISEDTPRATRLQARQHLADGTLRALVSIDALGVGFDCPPASCALMCRPTLSRGVFRQQAGRIMRTSPGKADALLLDMAGNVGRHGLPTAADITDLNGKVIPIPRRGRIVGLVNCAKCLCVFRSDADRCPECGAAKPHQKRVVRTVTGTLDEVVGIDATGAQEWATRASVDARTSWCRKKLSAGWTRARISAAHRSMFGCWPDWRAINAA